MSQDPESEAELRRILERAAERARPVPLAGLDVGIYPANGPQGPRTPWQDGWNAGVIAVTERVEAALTHRYKGENLAVCGAEAPDPCPECGDGLDAHVPTPEELDDLLAQVSACGHASEAVEVVENWTRKWWGVESADTNSWAARLYSAALPPDVVPHG